MQLVALAAMAAKPAPHVLKCPDASRCANQAGRATDDSEQERDSLLRHARRGAPRGGTIKVIPGETRISQQGRWKTKYERETGRVGGPMAATRRRSSRPSSGSTSGCATTRRRTGSRSSMRRAAASDLTPSTPTSASSATSPAGRRLMRSRRRVAVHPDEGRRPEEANYRPTSSTFRRAHGRTVSPRPASR